MIWEGNTVAFNGVKENGIEIAKNVVGGILGFLLYTGFSADSCNCTFGIVSVCFFTQN